MISIGTRIQLEQWRHGTAPARMLSLHQQFISEQGLLPLCQQSWRELRHFFSIKTLTKYADMYRKRVVEITDGRLRIVRDVGHHLRKHYEQTPPDLFMLWAVRSDLAHGDPYLDRAVRRVFPGGRPQPLGHAGYLHVVGQVADHGQLPSQPAVPLLLRGPLDEDAGLGFLFVELGWDVCTREGGDVGPHGLFGGEHRVNATRAHSFRLPQDCYCV